MELSFICHRRDSPQQKPRRFEKVPLKSHKNKNNNKDLKDIAVNLRKKTIKNIRSVNCMLLSSILYYYTSMNSTRIYSIRAYNIRFKKS